MDTNIGRGAPVRRLRTAKGVSWHSRVHTRSLVALPLQPYDQLGAYRSISEPLDGPEDIDLAGGHVLTP